MTERLQLSPRHREQLEALLCKHLPEVEVWAYGSRVDGRSHDGSDLDLVLRGPGLAEIDLTRLADFQQALHDSTIPFLVEARDWARLPERFHREIEGQYVVLLAKPSRGDWPRVRVEEIAEKVAMGPFGSSIKVETYVPQGVPVINGKHLHGRRLDEGVGFDFICEEHADRLANANVGPGDIVFTHRGTIGQVSMIPRDAQYERYVVSQSQMYLRCDESRMLPEFTALWFASAEGRHALLANTSQVGVPSIAQPASYVKTIPIPLPPMDEQRAIAHILGALDDKIELNRRMNETLEAMARALFKSWFVDFDPVRAKMEGRDTGLPEDVAGLFSDRLVDSEMGETPEGWRAGTLADVAELNPESWGRKNTPDGVRYVDLANTKWGVIESVQPHAWGSAPSRARRVLRPGDTIVGTVRPGNGSFALVDRDGLTGSTGFAVLRPKAAIGREIVYCAATSHGNIARLARLADGGAYPAVNPTTVLGTAVVLPEARTRAAFSELTAPLLSQLHENQREARVLASTRDTLLPKLVSGEIRLRESPASFEPCRSAVGSVQASAGAKS